MATARLLRLHSSTRCSPSTFRSVSSRAPGHRQYSGPPQQEFSDPSKFLGSWEKPSDPQEAQARLHRLRKDYARQVNHLRREYTHEMELLRVEKQRKDEAKREAARLANEQRRKAKAAAAQSRAAERMAFQEEFRQTLLKERAEKLENWRTKEASREQKNTEKKGLLRQQSSIWVAEENLEKRILEAIIDSTPL